MPKKMGEWIKGVGGDIMVFSELCVKIRVRNDSDYARACKSGEPCKETWISLDASNLEDLIDQLTAAREVLWANLGRKIEGGGNGLA